MDTDQIVMGKVEEALQDVSGSAVRELIRALAVFAMDRYWQGEDATAYDRLDEAVAHICDRERGP